MMHEITYLRHTTIQQVNVNFNLLYKFTNSLMNLFHKNLKYKTSYDHSLQPGNKIGYK